MQEGHSYSVERASKPWWWNYHIIVHIIDGCFEAKTHTPVKEQGTKITAKCVAPTGPIATDMYFDEQVKGNCRVCTSQSKGSIPKWLSRRKKLQMLDLSWNHLSGSIPSWFGKFDNLFYLDLSNNSFTGNNHRV
ncbi:hypothetical protein JHK84_044469 [Glycine max]|nr:hypothetical protein JHK84_044469 [Glycine max]